MSSRDEFFSVDGSKAKRVVRSCDFCLKNDKEVRLLIAAPNNTHICDECISLCNEIVAEKDSAPADLTGPVTDPPASGTHQVTVTNPIAMEWAVIAAGVASAISIMSPASSHVPDQVAQTVCEVTDAIIRRKSAPVP